MKATTQYHLSAVIVRYYLALAAGALLLFAVATYFVIRSQSRDFLTDHFSVQQRQFAEHISGDLLSGANSEIHRKCQAFFAEGSVASLRVRGTDGDLICDLRHSAASADVQIQTPIYFDEFRREVATVVEAAYSEFEGRRFLIVTCVVIAITMIAVMALQYLLGNKIGKHVTAPITRLASLLNDGDVKKLVKIPGRPRTLSVKEVDALFTGMESLASTVTKYQAEIIQREQLAAIGRVAAQVAHDIRSPLTALRVAVGHMAGVGEEQRVMMRRAVQRIEDIANDLARRPGAGGVAEAEGAAPSVQLVSSLVESLISEKRTQIRGRMGVAIEAMIDADTYGVFAAVEPHAFRRVVSNLINNAVEALADNGAVTVAMAADATIVRIQVRDTGKGIPPEVLPQLMQRGVTVGKTGGKGLGLFHARETVEKWGGRVTLDSQLGVGTTVTVTLPRAAPLPWFVSEIVLSPGSPVVIIDDDATIHQVWQERFASLDFAAHDIAVQHFSTSNDVLAWQEPSQQTVYLCDYELLGDPRNGLDLIERLDIADRAILVTSRYEEPAVQARCAQLGVRIVPKGLAGVVPVRVAAREDIAPTAAVNEDVSANLAILVIDDDKDVRWGWTLVQDEFHITTLSTFPSMEACVAAQLDYGTYAAAFVDKHIPDSMWTLDRTIAHLKAAGIPRVIVASGEGLDLLHADPACAAADGFCQMKVPEELAPYLSPPLPLVRPATQLPPTALA